MTFDVTCNHYGKKKWKNYNSNNSSSGQRRPRSFRLCPSNADPPAGSTSVRSCLVRAVFFGVFLDPLVSLCSTDFSYVCWSDAPIFFFDTGLWHLWLWMPFISRKLHIPHFKLTSRHSAARRLLNMRPDSKARPPPPEPRSYSQAARLLGSTFTLLYEWVAYI